ncbi:3-oxoacyl-[acyl-carrier-protein] synthase III C-terminal domain-containing protein [Alkalibacillus silvisoli]|uniref:3-oxoacyl-[acyl-carrier-protein] synthase III C-terminal domain-containing protein n=1 Tax=Alkalibacillus silvisoli TaxID=392823 RepID=UPI003CD063EB
MVVGSDYLSLFSDPDDAVTYGNFGDAACAVILEKTKENTGFIDASYRTETTEIDGLVFPHTGLSNFLTNPSSTPYIKEVSKPKDTMPETFMLFDDLLFDHGMTMDDIDYIAPSQSVFKNVERIREQYSLNPSQMLYIGDRYGYTAVTSPILALYEGIQSGKVKRGDQVLFYTIGTGHVIIAMLFKY